VKTYFITFRSVTFGQRGEQVLKEGGIRCELLRTPKWMEERGCGYSLRFRAVEPARAVGLLEAMGVPMRKVYVQSPQGRLEEVVL
jgi:hypothetical protein